MTLRVCVVCMATIPAGKSRCPRCQRAREKERGTRQERGYDAQHDALRREWVPKVAEGRVRCRRAQNGTCVAASPLIRPGQPWDLGHPDAACPAPTAPEHERCNRRTAAWRIAPDT